MISCFYANPWSFYIQLNEAFIFSLCKFSLYLASASSFSSRSICPSRIRGLIGFFKSCAIIEKNRTLPLFNSFNFGLSLLIVSLSISSIINKSIMAHGTKVKTKHIWNDLNITSIKFSCWSIKSTKIALRENMAPRRKMKIPASYWILLRC